MINLVMTIGLIGVGAFMVVAYAEYKSKTYRNWVNEKCNEVKLEIEEMKDDEEYIEADRKFKETYASFMKTVELINETKKQQLEAIDKTIECSK